jgi:hypothetical protein
MFRDGFAVVFTRGVVTSAYIVFFKTNCKNKDIGYTERKQPLMRDAKTDRGRA